MGGPNLYTKLISHKKRMHTANITIAQKVLKKKMNLFAIDWQFNKGKYNHQWVWEHCYDTDQGKCRMPRENMKILFFYNLLPPSPFLLPDPQKCLLIMLIFLFPGNKRQQFIKLVIHSPLSIWQDKDICHHLTCKAYSCATLSKQSMLLA